MNVLNAIPIFGWLIASIVCFIVAIPVYFLWNWLIPIYGTFLPALFQHLPFWHVFGLLWLIESLKGIIFPSFSISQTQKK